MGGRWIRLGLAGLAATVLGLGIGAPAHAHNAFAGSTPKDGAVLDRAPATVNLKFLEKLVAANVTVTISDPAGTSAVAGVPSFDGPTVMVPLRPTTAGPYTVTYAVRSVDGHPVTGKITFTLTATAVPAPGPTPSPTPSPTVAPAPATVTASDAAAPVLAGDQSGAVWWPWPAGGVLVLGGLALVYVRRRRGRPA